MGTYLIRQSNGEGLMAKKNKSGASVGLIVTLVFFVLATLIAGTMAYSAQEDIKTAEGKAADATKKLKDMDDQRREERIRKVMDRFALGIEDTEKDRTLLVQELEPLRITVMEEYDRIKRGLNEKGASVTRKELDNLVKEMDRKNLKGPDDKMELGVFTFSWPLLSMTAGEVAKVNVQDADAAAAGPAVGPLLTVPAMIGIYETRAAQAETARKNAEAKAADFENLAKKSGDEKTNQKKAFDDKLAEIQKEKVNKFNEMAIQFKQLADKHMADHRAAQTLAADRGAAVTARDDRIGALEDNLKKMSDLLAKLQPKAKGVDFVNLEEKKGEIVRKEEGGFVTIDIGSSKKLRPQITFLVVSSNVSWLALLEKEESLVKNSYRLDRQPFEDNPYVKAGIEVVDILGPDSARAKIVFENEPIRNPVQVHDQIFNLAWQPAEEIRVAFAGIIDLDGDGLDNNEDFLRMLERQNIVVDEYLKLKPLTFMKRDGKGMSLQTRYLVMAADPHFDAFEADTPQRRHAQKVLEQMSDIRQRAKELGVQLIDANKFLAMIGYKLPKKPLPPQYGAAVYFPGAAAAPEAKKD
jgi:hypothetical protein